MTATSIPTSTCLLPPDTLIQIDRKNEEAVRCIFDARLDAGEALCQQNIDLIGVDTSEAARDFPAEMQERLANCLLTYGRVCCVKSEPAAALEHFQEALTLYEWTGNPAGTARCSSFLGSTYMDLGDFARAAELIQAAVQLAREIGDEALEGECLNNLGYNYIQAGDPQPAISSLERSVNIFRRLDDAMRLSWSLDSLGHAFLQMGKKQQGLTCILDGYQQCRRSRVWLDELRFMGSVGKAYRECGETAEAQEIYSDLLALARRHGCRGEESDALLNLADIEVSHGHAPLALEYLEGVFKITSHSGVKAQLCEAHRLRALACKQMGDFKGALESFEKYHEIDHSLYNKGADQRLKNLQVLHQVETARKQTEIYQLRANSLQKEVEERRKTQAILEHLARTDPLTDIYNRRAFFDLANKEFQTARSQNRPLALILVDVDHFKLVNDHYGHQAGDSTLVLVVERMRTRVRSVDFLARFGGEEFVILLPGTGLEPAFHLAERLRGAVSDHPFHLQEGVDLPITLSLGVASWDAIQPLESLDLLISHADQALYRAKRSGRNQVKKYCVHRHPPHTPYEAA